MSLLKASTMFNAAVQDDTLRLLDSTHELPILGCIIGDESSMVRWLSCIDNAMISPAKCALTDIACLHLCSCPDCVYGRQLQPQIRKYSRVMTRQHAVLKHHLSLQIRRGITKIVITYQRLMNTISIRPIISQSKTNQHACAKR